MEGAGENRKFLSKQTQIGEMRRISHAGQLPANPLVGQEHLNLNFHDHTCASRRLGDHRSPVVSAELCPGETEESPLREEMDSGHYSTPCPRCDPPSPQHGTKVPFFWTG